MTATLADGDRFFVSVRIGPDGAVQADEPLEIDTTIPCRHPEARIARMFDSSPDR